MADDTIEEEMRGAAAKKGLKKLLKAKVASDPASAKEWYAGLHDETDRSLMILAASLVEDSLSTALKGRMSHLNNTEIEGLFGLERAMGSFSRLVDMAYALLVIQKRERDTCHLVRELRNAAAHAQTHIDFDTPEVVAILDAMFEIPPPPGRPSRRIHWVIACATLAESVELGPEEAMRRFRSVIAEVQAETDAEIEALREKPLG